MKNLKVLLMSFMIILAWDALGSEFLQVKVAVPTFLDRMVQYKGLSFSKGHNDPVKAVNLRAKVSEQQQIPLLLDSNKNEKGYSYFDIPRDQFDVVNGDTLIVYLPLLEEYALETTSKALCVVSNRKEGKPFTIQTKQGVSKANVFCTFPQLRWGGMYVKSFTRKGGYVEFQYYGSSRVIGLRGKVVPYVD